MRTWLLKGGLLKDRVPDQQHRINWALVRDPDSQGPTRRPTHSEIPEAAPQPSGEAEMH